MDLTPHIHTQHSVSGAIWTLSPPNERIEQMLMQRYGVCAPVASFLSNRFFADDDVCEHTLQRVEHFLSPKLRTSLPDPYVMVDMQKLVSVLYEAITHKHTIAIFGDYDVDGATSTALMVRYLQAIGAKVLWHVPERQHGYGPNIQAFQDLYAQGADIIVCVDCGSTAFEVLDTAHQHNMRICVIDHHIAQPQLPQTVAMVNPNRIDDSSQLGNLCAVGVCFCVLVALNRYLRQQRFFTHTPEPNMLQWIDLVAIGTVCDVVPLQGLNRTFVAQGLKALNGGASPAVQAICQVAGISGSVGVYELGWIIGPYLNACGRMGRAKLAVEFLLTDDMPSLGAMAATLYTYNTDRKQLVEDALHQCHQMVATGGDYGGFISVKGDWADGIIGIVAGRLKDHYNKPALVFCSEGTLYKGSARSVSAIDVGATFINAVQSGILGSGGGHKVAAGCSVSADMYDSFMAYLQSVWTTHVYDKIYRAHTVISPSVLRTDTVRDMDILHPYGVGNPEPLYIIENVYITSYTVLKQKHIKFYIRTAPNEKALPVIAFQVVDTKIGDCVVDAANTVPVSILGKLQINRWQGKESVQFLLQDIAV